MPTDEYSVVVGVDGSPSSLQAVEWAADEARLRQRTLRVLCAYGWPWNDLPLAIDAMTAADSTREAAEQVAAEAVDHARALAPELDITTELSADTPAKALIEASRHA